MANENNLTPWQPGQSGNPAGKPKGTKHLSTWIQEMMEDDNFTRKLANGRSKKEAPVKAIVTTLMNKALDGDMKAFDLLAKYGYGTRLDVTSKDKEVQPFFGLGSGGQKYVRNMTDEQLDAVIERKEAEWKKEVQQGQTT